MGNNNKFIFLAVIIVVGIVVIVWLAGENGRREAISTQENVHFEINLENDRAPESVSLEEAAVEFTGPNEMPFVKGPSGQPPEQ